MRAKRKRSKHLKAGDPICECGHIKSAHLFNTGNCCTLDSAEILCGCQRFKRDAAIVRRG